MRDEIMPMRRFGAEGLVRGAILVIIAIGAALMLSRSALHLNLSRWLDDTQHRLLGPVLDMRDVVVVDIDEESIEVLKPAHGAWPYSRDLYARLIHDLSARGAKTIAFDILLAEARPGDAEFVAALNENVVLAAAAFPRPPLRSDSYMAQIDAAALNDAIDARSSLNRVPAVDWPDVTLPVASFTEQGKARVGIISVHPDDDGTVRRMPLFHAVHGRLLASFPLASWISPDALRQAVFVDSSLRLAGRHFAVDEKGQIGLRFPTRTENLVVVPFHQLVAGEPFMAGRIDWGAS